MMIAMKKRLLIIVLILGVLSTLLIAGYRILFPNEDLTMEEHDTSHLQADTIAADSGTKVLSLESMMGTFESVMDSSEVFFVNGGSSGTSGRFNDFFVELIRDSVTAKTEISVTIQSKSIFTDNDIRDRHLQNEEFFNTAGFPQITFNSAEVLQTDSNYSAVGEMFFLGTDRKISIPFKYLGNSSYPSGTEYHVLVGGFTFNPADFGMDVGITVDEASDVSFYLEMIRSE
jgi:polyisoprenoid-binding protein YceI